MHQFKRALITGATSGIGEALARLIASKGTALILTGRNHVKLNELKLELSHEVPVSVIVADLQSRRDRKELISFIKDNPVDLVINNAGSGLYGPAISKTSESLLGMLELDAAAVLELTVESAKMFSAAKEKGVIMNISSAAAFQIMPNFAVYSASKAFVNTFSQAIDYELKNQGIRVLTACPGKVATQFSSRASEGKVKTIAGGTVMTPEYAAKQIWNQIQSQKSLHIFDWKYAFSTFISYLFPKALVVWIASTFMKHK